MVCHEHNLRAMKNMAHLKVVVGQGEIDLRICETFAMISTCIQNVSKCVLRICLRHPPPKEIGKKWAPRQCCRPDLHPLEQSYQGQMAHRPPSRIQMFFLQLNQHGQQIKHKSQTCEFYGSFCLAYFSSHLLLTQQQCI